MRVIITGGTGLVGRALMEDLIADGYHVSVLSRTPERATGLPSGARVVGWDARSAEGWGSLADGSDAIVNLAGESIFGRWTPARKGRIRESRVNAGRAVVEAVELAEVKPRLVVQASGMGYYGHRGDELITEEASAGEDYLGRTAVEWEASTAPVESLGVRRVVIRSGVVLSRDGGAFPLMALPFRLFVGGPLGDGDQWLPWIHIADEVRSIRFLMEMEEAHGPFHLTAPEPLTNADFSRVLARVLRRPAFFRVPAFAVRLLLGQMSVVVLEGQRAVPRRLRDLGFDFRFPEGEAALRDLLE
ncbi:MAG: TIGR01777 family oxidoreductase [Anaerolineae bacterium]